MERREALVFVDTDEERALCHLYPVQEVLDIVPRPIDYEDARQFGRQPNWSIVLGDVHAHDRHSLLPGRLDLPEFARSARRVAAHQSDDTVAAFDPRTALGLPGFVPRLLGRHVDEFERRPLVLGL